MAKTSKLPNGTSSTGDKPSGAKGKGSAKGAIKPALLAKIEELVRTSELDMMLQRRNLGLEKKGDMREFILPLIRSLKKRKPTR